MKVIMCQSQFVGPILAGEKIHTIRGAGKRTFYVGEQVSLRHWIGAAYRSKQREFARVTITEIREIRIGFFHRTIHLGDDSWPLGPRQAERLAQNDGFRSLTEMLVWFRNTHGLPFTGRLIHFELCASAPLREVGS